MPGSHSSKREFSTALPESTITGTGRILAIPYRVTHPAPRHTTPVRVCKRTYSVDKEHSGGHPPRGTRTGNNRTLAFCLAEFVHHELQVAKTGRKFGFVLYGRFGSRHRAG